MLDEGKTGGTSGAAASESSANATKAPEIVVSSRALQVAKAWVKNMTGGGDSDSEDDDEATTGPYTGPRPTRLGLGAKYVPHSLALASMTPVEKKLRARINAARQGDPDGDNELPGSASGKETTCEVEIDEEGDNEGKDSKSSAFGRKQRNTTANLLMPTSKAGKRKRGK